MEPELHSSSNPAHYIYPTYDTVGLCLKYTPYFQENDVETTKPLFFWKKKTLSSGILLVKPQKANANYCGWIAGDLPTSALPDVQLLNLWVKQQPSHSEEEDPKKISGPTQKSCSLKDVGVSPFTVRRLGIRNLS